MTSTPSHNPTPAANGRALSRRSLLAAAAVLPVGLSAASTVAASSARSVARPANSVPSVRRDNGGTASSRPAARNVIFMVADGMSTGTLTLADLVSEIRTGNGLLWPGLWKREGVRRATAKTYAADSWVTDSAAGGSAWGIGERINNNAVNVTPDGRTPTPILVQARQSGKATGLVTTTTVTHATPASFIANIPSRKLEAQIAEQIMERGVDVVLGGGREFFPPSTLALRTDCRVVTTADELAAARDATGPLLGLFNDSHLNFDLDRPETEPDIEAMTRAALARLARHPDGFVLQIEGGRVDHGCHSNDAAGAIFDLIAFDRAVGAVLEFAEERDDTLVIITTDHGNGNPGQTLYGRQSIKGMESLAASTRSFEWIQREAIRTDVIRQPAELAALIAQATSVSLTDEEQTVLARSLIGEPVDPFLPRCTLSSVMGSLLANHTGVAFVSPNHTSDLVEVTALGPGSDAIRGLINNYDLHKVMVGALSLSPVAGG